MKGVGGENIAKVAAPIDIAKANTISSLWKFAGFSVEAGGAPKRVKGGGKLAYNSQLRSMCWATALPWASRLANNVAGVTAFAHGY